MRFAFSFIIVFASAFHYAHAQNLATPVEYLSYVSEQGRLISDDMMAYTSATSHNKSARKVEKKRLELMQTIKQSVFNMRRLKPFKGDHALRDSTLAYFQIVSALLNEDYAKIVNMEEIAEQSYDAMEAFLLAKEKANERTSQASKIYEKEFNAFALRNNINLTESSSKLSKKMEEAGAVFKYYNQVYLLFFKSFKDELYWFEALKKDDVNALEQTKNTLLANSKEGLRKISLVPAYNDDKSLKTACEQALKFYNDEATRSAELANFYLKKDNFEKSKKALESKKPADRTQQDVDTFNKLVSDFNASVAKYNQLNAELDKKRQEVLSAWNKAADNFLNRHVPTHR
jgi:hypothetical protein